MEYIAALNREARAQGKYLAIGGHKAETDYRSHFGRCAICGRAVTESNAGVRHAARKSRKGN